MEKLRKFCLRMIAGIGSLIFLFLTYYSWRYTAELGMDEITNVRYDRIWMAAAGILAVWPVVLLLGKTADKLTDRAVQITAVIVSLAAAAGLLVFAGSAHAYSIADQWQVYDAAVKLYYRDYEGLLGNQYLTGYPYQLALAELFKGIFRITGGTEPVRIHYVQSLCAGLSIYAGFGITRELFHNRLAELLYLFCAVCFLPMGLYTLFVYGETLGVLGALLGILFFLKMNRQQEQKPYLIIGWGTAAGAVMIAAVIARSPLMIVWIAMSVIQLLLFLKNRRVLPLVMMLVILVISVGGRQLMMYSLEEKVGIELGEGMPVMAWLPMAFGAGPEGNSGPGSYNAYNWTLYEQSGYDKAVTAEAARQELAECFRIWKEKPGEMVSFFREKILNQWNEPSCGAFEMTRFTNDAEPWVDAVYSGPTKNMLYAFLDRYQAAAYLAILVFFISLFRGEQDGSCYLIGLILIGGFLFSAIWEAKSRYVYPYMVIALPYMAIGLTMCYSGLGALLRKLKEFLWEHLNGWAKK